MTDLVERLALFVAASGCTWRQVPSVIEPPA